MNQTQMMNQISQAPGMNPMPQAPGMNPMGQAQAMNQMNQPSVVNQPQVLSQPQMLNPPPMLNPHYGRWPPQPAMDSRKFPNPLKPGFAVPNSSKQGRSNWKGNKPKDRRGDKAPINAGGYRPPTLNELQSQNRLKARKFYSKKKFNNRFVPFAPRNTTSFIIRAKKSGGIASLVSPCPVTPAVLPTPIFSPSSEVLVDMAKEEWGVDGYGSMKGLIRLRSPGHEADPGHEEEEEDDGGSSESDVEEHVEVERRLDHDLSRFEMIYPNYGVEHSNILGNRVDDQDTHIAHLEEENLTLKERLFLMEGELSDLRRRIQKLEQTDGEDLHEEVVENCSENESEGRAGGAGGEFVGTAEGKEQVVDSIPRSTGEAVAEAEAEAGEGSVRTTDTAMEEKRTSDDGPGEEELIEGHERTSHAAMADRSGAAAAEESPVSDGPGEESNKGSERATPGVTVDRDGAPEEGEEAPAGDPAGSQ